MAKTVLQARQDGVQFYMNTESSSPGTGHRNRYRLFRTENVGRGKSGWVQIGSQVGQKLIAIEDGGQRFERLFPGVERKASTPVPRARTYSR